MRTITKDKINRMKDILFIDSQYLGYIFGITQTGFGIFKLIEKNKYEMVLDGDIGQIKEFLKEVLETLEVHG